MFVCKVTKTMALLVALVGLSACATAEETKPMMMGQCDPAKCAMCASKMGMGEKMNCDMMKAMPSDKMKMMDDCMKNMGMMGGMNMTSDQSAQPAAKAPVKAKAKAKKQTEEDHTAHHPDAAQ